MQPGWRKRRLGAALIAAAVVVPLLLAGGALAHAAVSAPGAPLSVSVSETGNGQGVPSPSTSTSNTSNVSSAPTDDSAIAPSESAEQTLSVSVLPGPLTVTPSTESTSFTKMSDGSWQAPLSTVTVVDARGSLVGWQATVTLQSLDGVPAADLAQARLCVSPGAAVAVAGRQSEVRTGRDACGGANDPLTLFFAPPDGGGGTFDDTGLVTLHVPNDAGTGSVAATLSVAVH
jgi:hypothetical protein